MLCSFWPGRGSQSSKGAKVARKWCKHSFQAPGQESGRSPLHRCENRDWTRTRDFFLATLALLADRLHRPGRQQNRNGKLFPRMWEVVSCKVVSFSAIPNHEQCTISYFTFLRGQTEQNKLLCRILVRAEIIAYTLFGEPWTSCVPCAWHNSDMCSGCHYARMWQVFLDACHCA